MGINRGEVLRTPGYPHVVDSLPHPGLTDVGKDPILFWMGAHHWNNMLERVGHQGQGSVPDGFKLWQEPHSAAALAKPMGGPIEGGDNRYSKPVTGIEDKAVAATTCRQCGKSFAPRRTDAEYCSGNCRVAALRARQRSPTKAELQEELRMALLEKDIWRRACMAALELVDKPRRR